jgi:hypothetical protein
MTNVLNMHTCSIGLINLFIVVVYISHDKLIQISDHLISCPSVSNISRFFFPHVCRIKPLVALEDGVIDLFTKLARGGGSDFSPYRTDIGSVRRALNFLRFEDLALFQRPATTSKIRQGVRTQFLIIKLLPRR